MSDILKKTCEYCGKEFVSLYRLQLEQNLASHQISCPFLYERKEVYSIAIEASLWEAVEKYAEMDQRSCSFVVRLALIDFLKRHPRNPSTEMSLSH